MPCSGLLPLLFCLNSPSSFLRSYQSPSALYSSRIASSPTSFSNAITSAATYRNESTSDISRALEALGKPSSRSVPSTKILESLSQQWELAFIRPKASFLATYTFWPGLLDITAATGSVSALSLRASLPNFPLVSEGEYTIGKDSKEDNAGLHYSTLINGEGAAIYDAWAYSEGGKDSVASVLVLKERKEGSGSAYIFQSVEDRARRRQANAMKYAKMILEESKLEQRTGKNGLF